MNKSLVKTLEFALMFEKEGMRLICLGKRYRIHRRNTYR